MQAHVKTPHISIKIEGDIPSSIIKVLKKEYGDKVSILPDDDLIDINETEWYKKTKQKMTPGKYLKVHRENQKMTQQELGEKLGGVPRQHISNMEHGIRAISIDVAEKLARLFNVSVDRFL